MTQWLAGMVITADRLNDGLDLVTTSSGLVAATGFSVTSFAGARIGRAFTLDMIMHRTGADITVSGGNIADTDICTVPAGWRPTVGTINGQWDDGTAEGGFVIGTNGVCTLRTSNGSILRGDTTAPTGNGSNPRLHIDFFID
ncbi:hypothetical protein HY68_12670 [Streptomyces sp. AcH 505]|uniref:hypothetical protein n=1 Tax=Streptomyces sp. AcH 505 TaxID=352211 RepID=UPI0005923005|nr:hypothetical protein HY68_12670 [Streptomyces sp. AcH 505]